MIVADGSRFTIDAWKVLEDSRDALQLPDFKVEALESFSTQLDERRLLLEEHRAILANSGRLLSNFYVHQRFKRQEGKLDPASALAQIESEVETLSGEFFHLLVRNVFVQQADAHTYYGLPEPYRDALAFLPFPSKHYVDLKGTLPFVGAKQMMGFHHSDFEVGAEVVTWSGIDVGESVEASARSEGKGNAGAFLANGLTRMCVRPLTFALRPQLLLEQVGYVPLDGGERREIVLPWGVGRGLNAIGVFQTGAATIAYARAQTAAGSQIVWNTEKCIVEKNAAIDMAIDSKIPELFEFQTPEGRIRSGFLRPEHLVGGGQRKRLGYLRIKGFGKDDAEISQEGEICEEFARLLRLMMERAPHGLVLNIRGNSGGNVKAAEGMLQMLTPIEIVPARFHWRWNEALKTTLKKAKVSKAGFGDLSDADNATLDGLVEFTDWLDDLEAPVGSLPEFLSSGKPVTDVGFANETGQIYQGPVVLLIDAFTYSAANIFAAGFQDHQIGTIVGVTEATGGGWATRWKYLQFNPVVSEGAEVELSPLPEGVTMAVALQRPTRVLKNKGVAVEDVGVKADPVFAPPSREVLEGGADLIEKTCELLWPMSVYRLEMTRAAVVDGGLQLTVRQDGRIADLRCTVNGNTKVLTDTGRGSFSITAAELGRARRYRVALRGFDEKGQSVVAAKRTLEVEEEG